MRKLEIILTEEQYQHIEEEIKNAYRVHLSEDVFGGYELYLSVGIPDVFPATLEIKTNESKELGEVRWRIH